MKFLNNCNGMIFFFFDPWMDGISFFEKYGQSIFSWFNCHMNVRMHEVIHNGIWHLLTTSYAPPYCVNAIMNMTIDDSNVNCLWKGKTLMTNKSVYNFLFEGSPSISWSKHIWFKGYSLKYACTA